MTTDFDCDNIFFRRNIMKNLDSWSDFITTLTIGILNITLGLFVPYSFLSIFMFVLGGVFCLGALMKAIDKFTGKEDPEVAYQNLEVDKSELNKMSKEWLNEKLNYFRENNLYSATLELKKEDNVRTIVTNVKKEDLDLALTVIKCNEIRNKKLEEEKNQVVTETVVDLSKSDNNDKKVVDNYEGFKPEMVEFIKKIKNGKNSNNKDDEENELTN